MNATSIAVGLIIVSTILLLHWMRKRTRIGSFAKDKVELLLWRKVCVNKTMTLDQAKAVYLEDWTKLLPKK